MSKERFFVARKEKGSRKVSMKILQLLGQEPRPRNPQRNPAGNSVEHGLEHNSGAPRLVKCECAEKSLLNLSLAVQYAISRRQIFDHAAVPKEL